MVGENRVMMSMKELRRLHVIRRAMKKTLTQRQVGALLGLTDRQVRRLIERVRQEGDRGLVHRGRDQPSNRRIAARLKVRVLRLYEQHLGILGRRWRRSSWPSGRASRSVRRRLRLW